MLTDAVLLNQVNSMMGLGVTGLKVAQQQEQAAVALLQAGTEATAATLPPPAEGKGTVVDVLA